MEFSIAVVLKSVQAGEMLDTKQLPDSLAGLLLCSPGNSGPLTRICLMRVVG